MYSPSENIFVLDLAADPQMWSLTMCNYFTKGILDERVLISINDLTNEALLDFEVGMDCPSVLHPLSLQVKSLLRTLKTLSRRISFKIQRNFR